MSIIKKILFYKKVYKKVLQKIISVKKTFPRWVWFNCATEKYLSRRINYFKSKNGYSNREYIQRWSSQYITNFMIDLQSEYHSQSESSSIELVFYHNLTYEVIPELCMGIEMDKYIT